MSTTPDLNDCAGCAKLEDGSKPVVTLLSGQTVCSWCPHWRMKTGGRQQEANEVLRMVDRDTRRTFIASRRAEFGDEYADRLEAVVLATWKARLANPKTIPEDADDRS
jgi:hypothetical protein